MTTQELTKEVVDMKSRQAGMEEKMTDACARLVVVEHEVKEQGKLLQSIDRLTIGISSLQEKIKEMGTKIDVFGGRISSLELKPGKRWEMLVAELIKLIAAAAIGYALARYGAQ
jgi:hypothetical protein